MLLNMLWLCITSDKLVEKTLKAFADSCCRRTLEKIRNVGVKLCMHESQ